MTRWKHVFRKTYLIIVSLAALLATAVFFILQSPNPKTSIAEFTGEISGLPPSSTGTASKSAVLNVVDPTTVQLITGKEIEGSFSSYQIETSPGRRMAILKVWDFDSKVLYSGSSRIFNLSAGQTQKADIALKEAGAFNDISAPVSFQPAVFNTLTIFSKSFIAHAAEEKPVFAVIHKPGPRGPYSDQVADVQLTLVLSGNSVIATDQQSLDAIDEERNLKDLAPDTYGDFKPLEPNFVVELDIKFDLTWPIITISLINVENQEVIWKDTTDSRVETKAYGFSNIVNLAAEKLVTSLSGKGPNPVKLPAFTPSIPKPVKSMAQWRIKLRKLLGLDKQSESKPQSLPPPTTAPKLSCNIPAFRECANTFSLQVCIDACPYVDTVCPASAPPNTECKETDKACSDACWNKADAHINNCLTVNNCTKEEVIAGGGGAQR
ncbi:MAG: hypothetical protein HYT83_02105 [Candidatus Levybacteria bacterium]|nr:hypothetical protein [Candidatus Levybacteria bacterium]